MRGKDEQQLDVFSYVSPEQRVPQDHPLRPLRVMTDEALRELQPRFHKLYAKTGRPSIAPEKLLRALLLQALYSVRSERLLMEQLDYNLLFRWFVGLNMDDAIWDVTVFTKNRERLLDGDIAEAFFQAVLQQARERSLLSDEHFTVDGTLLEAWASVKSYQRKDAKNAAPGVLTAEPGARDAQNGGFSANGVRSTGENNFLLNGVDNKVNDIDFINQTSYVIGPSLDAIGEMRILTNGYNAEYGRAAGGVIDVSLKSGTNELHGSLFEYLQNTDLNANRWENNIAGVGRPPLKQNQFGLTAGGPIIKNKLFIFGDYQGTKIGTAGGVVQNLGFGGFYTIPTQAMVKGDFSGLLGGAIGTDPVTGNPILQNEIFDPGSTTCNAAGACTRNPFPGNVIPGRAMDPSAAKIAALYPGPNQPIVNGNYPQNDFYVVSPGALRTDQGDGRVDYKIDDKDSLFGSISWSDTNKTNTAPFAGALDGANFYGASEQDLGRNAQIGYTRIWSPTFISETRIAYSRLVTARTQGNANTDEFKAYGIAGLDPTTTLNGGLPQFGMGQYSQVGANDWLPTKEYSNVYDFIQNVAITKGSHAFKFGAEVKPIGFPFFQVPFPHGEMNFSRTETAFPSAGTDSCPSTQKGCSGNFAADTGDSFASF